MGSQEVKLLSPSRKAPELELSSTCPADSVLTQLLKVSSQSPGQWLLYSSAHLRLVPSPTCCTIYLKKSEPGSSGKSWKSNIKPMSSGNSHNSWGGPREELPGKEQCLKFSSGSLNSPWPSGLLSPPPSPMQNSPGFLTC